MSNSEEQSSNTIHEESQKKQYELENGAPKSAISNEVGHVFDSILVTSNDACCNSKFIVLKYDPYK